MQSHWAFFRAMRRASTVAFDQIAIQPPQEAMRNASRPWHERGFNYVFLTELLVLVGLAGFWNYLSVGFLSFVNWPNGMGGWCYPIANLLAEGRRLYTDGAHVCLPPLPFIAINWFSHGAPTWLDEDILGRFCTFLLPLALYCGTKNYLPKSISFISAAAIAIYPFDQILYNSSSVLFDVVSSLICLNVLYSDLTPDSSHSRRKNAMTLFLSGAFAAVAVLCKQSIGLAVALALILALFCFPSTVRFRRRIENAGLFLASLIGSFLIASLLLLRYISFPGMIRDVFIVGNETKGTRLDLVERSFSHLLDIGVLMRNPKFFLSAFSLVAIFLVARQITRVRNGNTLHSGLVTENGGLGAKGQILLALLVAAAVAPIPFLLTPNQRYLLFSSRLGEYLLSGSYWWEIIFLVVLFSAFSRRIRSLVIPGFLLAFAMWLGGLLSINAQVLRYSDFNGWATLYSPPLVYLGYVVFLLMIFQVLGLLYSLRRKSWDRLAGALQIVIAIAIVVSRWGYFPFPRMDSGSYESWPGVASLSGMKIERGMHGLYDLVGELRKAAGNGPDNSVLLFPSDPPFETTFQRPKPKLAAPVAFMDQYRDAFVERDLATLTHSLPKIIVLGPYPKVIWSAWYCRKEPSWGTFRLIEGIEKQLIPKHYDQISEVHQPQGTYYQIFRRRRG